MISFRKIHILFSRWLRKRKKKTIKKEEVGLSPIEINIKRNKKALLRYESELDELYRRWRDAGALCCPGCMFPTEYYELTDQIERTEFWLEKLKEKHKKKQ